MLIVAPEEAKAGMKLAAPVYHPDQPDQELLRGGYVLEDQVLARLRELGVAFVFVDYPGLEDLDRHIVGFLSPARLALYSQMKKTIESSQRRTHPAISYGDYYKATRELVMTLLSQGQHPVFLDQMSRAGSDGVGHATAVAHLSLLLGIKLEAYLVDERKRLPANRAKEIVNLGVAGMLHDLGKYQLSDALWNLDQTSPPDDAKLLEQYQAHPRLGYEQIKEHVEPTAASAVLQHHQHFDGSGFPAVASENGDVRRQEGKRIHIFARIILAADLYDRLATGGKARRSNLQVLRAIETRYAGWIDPVILRSLASVAPPFPPGSRLRLSDATDAVVIRVADENPYLPVVRRIAGEDWHMVGPEIDLGAKGSPRIVSPGPIPAAERAA